MCDTGNIVNNTAKTLPGDTWLLDLWCSVNNTNVESLHCIPEAHIILYANDVVQSPSCVLLFATPWTAAHQAPHPSPSPRVCPSSCPLHQ